MERDLKHNPLVFSRKRCRLITQRFISNSLSQLAQDSDRLHNPQFRTTASFSVKSKKRGSESSQKGLEQGLDQLHKLVLRQGWTGIMNKIQRQEFELAKIYKFLQKFDHFTEYRFYRYKKYFIERLFQLNQTNYQQHQKLFHFVSILKRKINLKHAHAFLALRSRLTQFFNTLAGKCQSSFNNLLDQRIEGRNKFQVCKIMHMVYKQKQIQSLFLGFQSLKNLTDRESNSFLIKKRFIGIFRINSLIKTHLSRAFKTTKFKADHRLKRLSWILKSLKAIVYKKVKESFFQILVSKKLTANRIIPIITSALIPTSISVLPTNMAPLQKLSLQLSCTQRHSKMTSLKMPMAGQVYQFETYKLVQSQLLQSYMRTSCNTIRQTKVGVRKSFK